MKTIKGKITRIMKDNKFEIGPRDQTNNAGMHRFVSILISDFHEGELVDITYNSDTGEVLEIELIGAAQKQAPKTMWKPDVLTYRGKTFIRGDD